MTLRKKLVIIVADTASEIPRSKLRCIAPSRQSLNIRAGTSVWQFARGNKERKMWMMEGKKYILTAEGLKKYEDELYYLKNERYKEITQAIKEARAQGDLSENAEYQAAKEEQRQVDARIEELEEMLTNVEVVDESEDNSVIRIGSTVRIKDLELEEILDYQIVGPSEANTDENMISNESPLGQALIGSVEGDVVSVQAPIGEIRYQVLEIGKRERN